MKIIDCFIFYNELDLLNYRLSILNDVVDYFVIVESTHTFTGKEKELFYDKNKNQFEMYQDKIIHIIIDDLPFKFPFIDYLKNEQWENEYHQRNTISRGISKISLLDNDILIISDLDEIPNPSLLLKIKKEELSIEINSLEQDLYCYNLNTQCNCKWYASKILTYNKFVELNINCNDLRQNTYPILQNSGWHLSYFGDEYFIQNKIQTFSHQELNTEKFTNIDTIKRKIMLSDNLYDRGSANIKISIKDNSNLPPNYLEYLSNYFSY